MTSIGAPQCGQTKVACGKRDGTAVAGLSGRRGWRMMQEFANGGDIVLAAGVGEEAVVADPMKACGQHVQQEAAHELLGCRDIVL